MTAGSGRKSWKPGALARNTAFATGWQSVRLALQFAYLILVARLLGPENYGVFSGGVALAASLSPLVGWGFGMILVQDVSRSPGRFPEFWAKAMRAVAVSGPVMVGLMLALSPLLLPVDGRWNVIVLIAAAELLAMPLVVASSHAFQAHERLGQTIFNHVQLNLVRLGAVALLAATGHGGLGAFAWTYFCATASAALLSMFQVRRAYGGADWTRGGLTGRWREGLGFSLSVAANTAHAEFDKTLLLRLGTAAAAGSYSVANRVVSAATMPLVAYILAAVPRLFREGEQGNAAVARLGRRLLLPILLYGLAAAAGLLVCAPLLPWVFGRGFGVALGLVPWLAPLPFLVGISQLGLNVLTASGRQRTRVGIEAMALATNLALNVSLIPRFGAEGAALAALGSQALLGLLPAVAVWRFGRDAAFGRRDSDG
jgi:O-antigen/teichoic acid export membrane protein